MGREIQVEPHASGPLLLWYGNGCLRAELAHGQPVDPGRRRYVDHASRCDHRSDTRPEYRRRS